MGVRISFTVIGEEQFAREILRVGERATAAGVRPVLSKIRRDWILWNREQFASQGARGSGGWAPLKPETVAAKGHSTILLETGRLWDALTNISNIDMGDDWLHLTLPNEVEDYATYHMTGTEHMPQRRPMEWTERDRREMIKDIQSWVMQGVLR